MLSSSQEWPKGHSLTIARRFGRNAAARLNWCGRPLLGQCRRWLQASLAASMDSLPVVDQELRPDGSFPYQRIHTPDPLQTVKAGYLSGSSNGTADSTCVCNTLDTV